VPLLINAFPIAAAESPEMVVAALAYTMSPMLQLVLFVPPFATGTVAMFKVTSEDKAPPPVRPVPAIT
jgi:hypothetical protein